MNVEEYMQCDGVGLAALVKKGDVQGRELSELALGVIETLNPAINAVLETWRDEAVPTGLEGRFAGVPFLIKDILIQRAGRRSELGSRLGIGNMAAANSFLMDRFDALGFHTLGRTTTPELGHGPTTEPVVNGPTRNPWDVTRMAGGSSGGAGAAVAAGMVPIAHGNDGAGSIRIPAACCGLIGLKVSRGRISSGPGSAEGLFGMGVELALTRSVRDTAHVLDGVAGPMAGDPFIIRQPEHSYVQAIEQAPRRLRIAITTTPWYDAPVDREVVETVERTAQLCHDLGHEVVEASPSFDYSAMRDACIKLWAAGMSRWAVQLATATGRSLDETTLEAASLAMVHYGSTLSASQLLGALDDLNGVCRAVGPFFNDHDCLLTPTTAQTARPVGTFDQNRAVADQEDWFDRKGRFPPFLALFNVTGQPGISLPVGQDSEGLPIGVQFVGRFGREEDLLMIARQLEEAIDWERRLISQQLAFWKSHSKGAVHVTV